MQSSECRIQSEPGSLFAGNVMVLESVDSTNTRLKELAEEGAPEGTVLMAGEQTAGRGTGERSFFSPKGEGLYLSVLLRPKASVSDLLTLTGRCAAAVRDGIERACGAPCQIKWLNDIYLNSRKVCGILAELSPRGDWVVLGVGINLCQTAEAFAAQGLDGIATSLAAEGYSVSREKLASAVLKELETMYRTFPAGKEEYLARYRAHCLTLGRQVNGGLAVEIDDDFALVVERGTERHTVFSVGEGVGP